MFDTAIRFFCALPNGDIIVNTADRDPSLFVAFCNSQSILLCEQEVTCTEYAPRADTVEFGTDNTPGSQLLILVQGGEATAESCFVNYESGDGQLQACPEGISTSVDSETLVAVSYHNRESNL